MHVYIYTKDNEKQYYQRKKQKNSSNNTTFYFVVLVDVKYNDGNNIGVADIFPIA